MRKMEINKDIIEGLLVASHLFEGELIFSISDEPLVEKTLRLKASDSLGFISIEHAAALRFLINKAQCNTSAVALFRLQYEALLKALWTFYIATDEQIDLIVGDLSDERAEKNNRDLPSVSKMLKQLEDANTPAHHTILQLIQFKDIAWKPLNSFVHSGLHAVKRNMHGYPDELIFAVIKQSNNLMYISAYSLAFNTGSQEILENISRTRKNFKDCLQLF